MHLAMRTGITEQIACLQWPMSTYTDFMSALTSTFLFALRFIACMQCVQQRILLASGHILCIEKCVFVMICGGDDFFWLKSSELIFHSFWKWQLFSYILVLVSAVMTFFCLMLLLFFFNLSATWEDPLSHDTTSGLCHRKIGLRDNLNSELLLGFGFHGFVAKELLYPMSLLAKIKNFFL